MVIFTQFLTLSWVTKHRPTNLNLKQKFSQPFGSSLMTFLPHPLTSCESERAKKFWKDELLETSAHVAAITL
jgi:hypothetical protein